METRLIHRPRNRQQRIASATLLVLCAAVWACTPLRAVAENESGLQQLQKDRVKAAVVLNIAKFVEWPEALIRTRENHLTLCYFREDVLGEAYDVIRNRQVNGRELQRKLVNEADEMGRCDMLLLSENGMKMLAQEAWAGADTPLLVVMDLTRHKPSERDAGKPYPGVHVTLVRRGSKIGFEINLSAANRAGLKLSSRLLRLARIVADEV